MIIINFWQGNITTISAEDLKPLPNLLMLIIGGQKLITIDGDLFKHTPWVTDILFNDNIIENVGLDLLTGLTNLTYVDFTSNTCINRSADTPAAIENLRNELISQCPPLATT